MKRSFEEEEDFDPVSLAKYLASLEAALHKNRQHRAKFADDPNK